MQNNENNAFKGNKLTESKLTIESKTSHGGGIAEFKVQLI